jgi:hypothetical protein
MKVGFTGTRVGISTEQLVMLNEVIAECEPTAFHHGDCIGADAQAWYIVRSHFPTIRIICHPPTNPSLRANTACDEYRRPLPYRERNRDLVHETDLLIACPRAAETERSGTWSTVRYAKSIGRTIIVIFPDGHCEVLPTSSKKKSYGWIETVKRHVVG